jgi:hypothetical protein
MLDLPVEYAIIGFDDPKFSGRIVPELKRLTDSGIVRLVDMVLIQKDAAGAASGFELNDLEPELYEAFAPFDTHVSSLFTQEDLEMAATWIPANSTGVLLLWENLWTASLRQAIMDAGGTLLDRGEIAPGVIKEVETARGDQ